MIDDNRRSQSSLVPRQMIQDVPNPYTGSLSTHQQLSDDKKEELYNYMVNRYIQSQQQTYNASMPGSAGINIQRNPSQMRANQQTNDIFNPEKAPTLSSVTLPETIAQEAVDALVTDEPTFNERAYTKIDQKLAPDTDQPSTLQDLEQVHKQDNALSNLVSSNKPRILISEEVIS